MVPSQMLTSDKRRQAMPYKFSVKYQSANGARIDARSRNILFQETGNKVINVLRGLNKIVNTVGYVYTVHTYKSTLPHVACWLPNGRAQPLGQPYQKRQLHCVVRLGGIGVSPCFAG
jgi:hypothetical protein